MHIIRYKNKDGSQFSPCKGEWGLGAYTWWEDATYLPDNILTFSSEEAAMLMFKTICDKQMYPAYATPVKSSLEVLKVVPHMVQQGWGIEE